MSGQNTTRETVGALDRGQLDPAAVVDQGVQRREPGPDGHREGSRVSRGRGPVSLIRDGIKPAVGSGNSAQQYDSWDGNNAATDDWVGYTFSTARTFTRCGVQEGIHFWDGGWFTAPPTVQVRQSGQWVTVSKLW